jgi:hypothetical protein
VIALSRRPPTTSSGYGIASSESRFPKLMKRLEVQRTEGAFGTGASSPKVGASSEGARHSYPVVSNNALDGSRFKPGPVSLVQPTAGMPRCRGAPLDLAVALPRAGRADRSSLDEPEVEPNDAGHGCGLGRPGPDARESALRGSSVVVLQ